MTLLLSALIVAAGLLVAAQKIVGELRAQAIEKRRARVLEMLALFAPGMSAAAMDPRALLTWQPLAVASRAAFPDVFAVCLDRSSGAEFPFSPSQLQAAHSRWTADWLAWEQAHDITFKAKVAAAEQDLASSGGSPSARARFDAVEREKLALYQQRYEEYVRTAKALQALVH